MRKVNQIGDDNLEVTIGIYGLDRIRRVSV